MNINNSNTLNIAFTKQQRSNGSQASALTISSLFSPAASRQPRQTTSRHRQPNINQLILNLILLLIKQLIDQLQNKQNKYRSIDGSNNNAQHPELGSANQPLRTLIPKDPQREIGGTTESRLPSAREISNIVADQKTDTVNKKGLSDMFWLWGQFLDHDINLTPHDESKEANIQVPAGDAYFDSKNTGDEHIGFFRSKTITDPSGRETQPNVITAYIDGSNIYGSNIETTNQLRSFSGGRLIESAEGLLPQDDSGQFISGDVRVNEHAGLSSMHTLWMREHNRVADKISSKHPQWTDEKVFQEARKQVIAQMQAITYNEFLPQLVGKDKIADYKGYNSDISPQISNSFSTAAYRLGHTMLSSNLLRLDEEGNEIAQGHLSLRNAFFNPDKVKEAGIDPILRGFASQTAQAVDPMVIDDVRNFLFGKPGEGGFDLAALNTQRGRDHGLSSLNDSREALGLRRITSFNDPVWQGDFGQKLAQVYDSPDDVDLWIGGLAEKAEGDSLVGATFTEILSDQFTRLRDADSFWYERQFSHRAVNRFNNTTLADVIKRNTGIQSLQDNVLVAQPRNPQPAVLSIQATSIRTLGAAANNGANSATIRLPAATNFVLPQPTLEREQEQRIRNALSNGFFG